MGSYNKTWHATIDTPEQMELCFNCARSECVDCIGRRLEGTERPKKEKKNKKKED